MVFYVKMAFKKRVCDGAWCPRSCSGKGELILFQQLLFVILIFIFTVHSWFDYRREIQKAKGEQEIRNVVVRFLLAIILFIISILVLLF